MPSPRPLSPLSPPGAAKQHGKHAVIARVIKMTGSRFPRKHIATWSSTIITSTLIGREHEWHTKANYISSDFSHLGLARSRLEISQFYLELELHAGGVISVRRPPLLNYVTVICIVDLTAERRNGAVAWNVHGFIAFDEKNPVVTWKNWYFVTVKSYFIKHVVTILISYTS